LPSKNATNFQILQRYVDYLNTILNQTITDSRLTVINRGEHLIVTRYQNKNFLPLELDPPSFLHFKQLAFVNSKGKVVVEDCRYLYSMSDNIDDEDKWIFRYEYNLKPDKNVPHAHIHLNGYCNNICIKHIHFPTGRVSIEQIIAHLILEHKIIPKQPGWFETLSDSHKGFLQRRNDPPMFP